MSRLTRLWKHFFLNASLLRTYGETMLIFAALLLLTILAYQTVASEMTITSLTFFVNPCSALYYSLRLRLARGPWHRTISLEVIWILVPTLLFNPMIWIITRTYLVEAYAATTDVRIGDMLFVGLLAFPYVFFRVGIRFILWWNYLRQRRVIWSLVFSNLLAVALLQVLVALPLAVAMFFSDLAGNPFTTIPNSLIAQLLYRLQVSLPLVGGVILAATTVLIALLPVSMVVSYFFARGMRRRLDMLLDAAHAARDGHYDRQIVVNGHDEIARLQADFNVMTAKLKINIDALRDEREKVDLLLKARRELMANVSHELRTPIATVRAYLESALRQQENESDVTLSQNDLAIIQRETVRLQTLIDDLFALSRAEVDQLALKLAPVDGVALIQHIIETVAPLAWQVNRVEMVANLPTWLPNVIADETRLEQVLRNLIHNSLRHTPPGGLIIISAREDSGYAELQVQDTGEGIQPEHLPHIWERYYRDAENGGTGLGLALVKSFVEAMHGQVAARSTLGEGACFTITLPLVKTPSVRSLPTPQPVLRPASAKSPTR